MIDPLNTTTKRERSRDPRVQRADTYLINRSRMEIAWEILGPRIGVASGVGDDS